MNTKDCMLYEDGKVYRCPCGCNVFQRAEDEETDDGVVVYRCNGCRTLVYATKE